MYVIEARKKKNPFFQGAVVLDSKKRETNEAYDGSTLPGIGQTYKLKYDINKGTFPVPVSPDILTTAAKKSGIVHSSGMYEGQLIDTVNPRNRFDPFYNEISIRINEGMLMLDENDPVSNIFIQAYMKGYDKRFAPRKLNDDRYPKEVIYLISQVGQEAQEEIAGFAQVEDLVNLMSAKTKQELFVVATILGIRVDFESVEVGTIKSQIYRKVERDSERDRDGKTALDRAIDILKQPSDQLTVKYLINMSLLNGRGKGIRKDPVNGEYVVGQERTGTKDLDALEKWLGRSENTGTLDMLIEEYSPKK